MGIQFEIIIEWLTIILNTVVVVVVIRTMNDERFKYKHVAYTVCIKNKYMYDTDIFQYSLITRVDD